MGSDKLLHTIDSLESYLYYMSRLMKHNRKIYNLAWKCSVYMYLLISKNIPSILIIDTAIIWAYPDSSSESVSTIYIYIPLAYEYLRESLSASAFRFCWLHYQYWCVHKLSIVDKTMLPYINLSSSRPAHFSDHHQTYILDTVPRNHHPWWHHLPIRTPNFHHSSSLHCQNKQTALKTVYSHQLG